MSHIVLFRPQIPPNTGNVMRLCANTGCTLHLVRPLGFDLTHRSVQRAGLDYADFEAVRFHPSLGAARAALASARWFSIETSGTAAYADACFEPGDALLFGPEHRGLPPEALGEIDPQRRLRIPMRSGNRSLNLANAVAVVVYEAWRQRGFAGS